MNKMITILSFSPRNSGNCAAISRYVSKYHEKHIVHSIVIDRNAVPACGNCDCECLKPNLACPLRTKEYDRIMDTVSQSDLVYFIVPNYCGYPCANYFSFNERSVGYFNMDRNKMEHYMSIPKRFIVISNSEGFEEAMQQQTNEPPEIMYLMSRAYGKSSIAGDILESDAAKADLDAFLSLKDL